MDPKIIANTFNQDFNDFNDKIEQLSKKLAKNEEEKKNGAK